MPQVRHFVVAFAAVAFAAVVSSSPVARAASPRDTMLTPVSWLAQHAKDPNLVILEVGLPDTYKATHVPGAQSAQMSDFTTPMDMAKLMTELPSDEDLRNTLQRYGISDHSSIVIVESDNYHSPSTRIYLTLVHAGFGAATSLLDGGLPAWIAAGQPTTADVPAPKTGTVFPLKTVKVTVDRNYVQAHEKTAGVVILDVRSPEAWQGLEGAGPHGPGQKFGHIPGSHSLPLEQLWDDATSRLRPAQEIEKIFADAGVKHGDTIVGYCYVGQRATATLFAAATLGYPVMLYDGSMDEWTRLNLPLEMPAKKGGGK